MNVKLQSKLRWKKYRGVISAVMMISFIIFLPLTSSAGSDNKVADIATLMQQKRVTLNIKDKPIRFILNEIKKQSGIGFIIKDSKTESELARMSISVSNLSIEKALETLLRGTGYRYSIENDVIMIDKEAVVKKQPVAQSPKIEISGTIINDEDRKPIAGATIIVDGTSNGAISDMNGKFTLTASVGNALSVSFVGKVEYKVVIKDSKPIAIILKSDAMAMDDVVVTGFGDVKRSSYTGNAVTVKREDLLRASKTNIVKALETFDPSFRIRDNNQWGSDPNALPEVNIRGGSSLGAKQATFGADGMMLERSDLAKSNLKDNPNLPTFIMDGFEISVTKLYDYDPNRIESITILKDAAATALYGSRAANGVVVIKTVTPKPGKINIQYNLTGELTFADLSDYNLLNAEQKLDVEKRGGFFTQFVDNENSNTGLEDQYKLDKEYNEKYAAIASGVDTYWLSQPLRTVFTHQHSLVIDGGTDNLRYGMDIMYKSQDGVMKESFRDRFSAGFFIQYNYKGLSVKNYTSYLQSSSQESPYGSFSDFTKQLPYNTFRDKNGLITPTLKSWSNSSDETYNRTLNPMYEPTLMNFDKTKDETLTNNLSVNWYINSDFFFQAQFTVEKNNSNRKKFYDPLSQRNAAPLSVYNFSSGELYLDYGNSFSYDLNTSISYNKALGNHMINFLAGYNVRESLLEDHNAKYIGFPSGALSSPNYAREQVGKTAYSDATSRALGFNASLNYTYNNIYLLDASVRVEGSSSFGANQRFAPFWSLGLGVNIHNYKFMEDSNVFDQLKIRGSYGQVGNASFSAYESLITYEVMNEDWYKTGYGATLMAYGNKDLKWETTNKLDVGFEVTMFKNLIYLRANYYDETTVDVINDVTIPCSTGFLSYKDNIGEVANRGYEFNLRIAAMQRKDMSLFITGNLAHNRNKIIKISESMKAYNRKVQAMYANTREDSKNKTMPAMQYEEGGSKYSIWGVPSLGINPSDGREIYVDRRGNMVRSWNTADQVILGNTEPKGRGALGLNFTYKQFSFYTSFMYEFGAQEYNQTVVDKVENVNVYLYNVDERVLTERWQKPGDMARYKGLTPNRNSVDQTRPTSRFVQDNNTLSWNRVDVSYDLPKKVTDKLHMGLVRLTVGMNDVFHLSTIKQERGLSYPYARSVSFTLNASF